ALRAARAHRPAAHPGGPAARRAAQHPRRHRDRLPPRAGRRGRAHVPRVPRRGRGAAVHRRGRRGPQPGRPAHHATPLRREPGARRAGAHRPQRARRGEKRALRAAFLALVLLNVAFFAWSRYLAPTDATADPQPLERQISPEKLKVVAPPELPAPAPAAAARPAPAPTLAAAP